MTILPFIKSTLSEGEAILKERFSDLGYLFIKTGIDSNQCQNVLDDFLSQLCPHVEWNSDRKLPILKGQPFYETDPLFDEIYPNIQALESFQQFFHTESVQQLMRLTSGENPFVYPMKMARISTPKKLGYETPAHQDAHSHQAPESMCGIWVALHDVTENMGRLMVLPKSQKRGVRPVHQAQGVGGVQCEIYEDETLWHTGNVEQGDVILFHACCVHKAEPNKSEDVVRLSVDTRFCPYGDPLFTSNLYPHHGLRIPKLDWHYIYKNWASPEHQFYWKDYPGLHGPDDSQWIALAATK